MFEKFTDRARKVMALANEEAQRCNHEYVDTGHVLIGLLKEGSGVGATVLKNLGADLPRMRSKLEEIIKPGPDIVTMRKLPHPPQAKKAIEYAVEEARKLNHNYVGTEHLLLGLLRRQKEDDGKYKETIAQNILRSFNVRLKSVREEILVLLGVKGRKKTEKPLSCKFFECGPSTEIEELRKKISKFLSRGKKIMRIIIIYDEDN